MATPDNSPIWTGTLTVWWPVALAVAITVFLAVLSSFAAPALLVLALVTPIVVLSLLAFTKVRVDVSPSEVLVAFTPLGWPVKRISMDEIVSSEVTDLRPLEWGGWGYRVKWKAGHTAVVLRGGEAIVIGKRSGEFFVVTIDDAKTGAAAIRSHLV